MKVAMKDAYYHLPWVFIALPVAFADAVLAKTPNHFQEISW
jgi:hypothetical protein